MSQSPNDDLDLELFTNNPQKNSRIKAIFLKLKERANGSDSLFPYLSEFEYDEEIKRETIFIKEFQQIILDYVFNFVKTHNRDPLSDKNYGLTINDISVLRTGMDALINEYERKDILRKYEIPPLTYFLSQIRRFFADKQNVKIRNSMIKNNKERIDREREIKELRTLLNKNEVMVQELIKEKQQLDDDKKSLMDSHKKEIEEKNKLITKKENEKSGLESEKNAILQKMDEESKKNEQSQTLEIASLRAKLNDNLKKGMTLEAELGVLKSRNQKLEENNQAADKELHRKEKQLTENTKIQKEILAKLKTTQDNQSKLIEQNQQLEHDLFDKLHSVKQQVNAKPFYLISVDLNNVSTSWNKHAPMRFQIMDLFTALFDTIKRIDSGFDINDISGMKGLIFYSEHNKKYEIDAKTLIATSDIAEFIKKFKWIQNSYRKGAQEQDIDTQLMAETIEHIIKYQDKIKGFLLASGDIDFIFAVKKAKEFNIKCYLLSHKKTLSKQLSENADSVFFY